MVWHVRVKYQQIQGKKQAKFKNKAKVQEHGENTQNTKHRADPLCLGWMNNQERQHRDLIL